MTPVLLKTKHWEVHFDLMWTWRPKGTKPWIPRAGRDSLTPTPLLGSAVQPSSAWEALESSRMTKERREERCGTKMSKSQMVIWKEGGILCWIHHKLLNKGIENVTKDIDKCFSFHKSPEGSMSSSSPERSSHNAQVVLVSWGCYNKLPQILWLKTADFFYLTVLEIYSLTIQSWCVSRTSYLRNPFSCLL
jgi:hypothetical protein